MWHELSGSQPGYATGTSGTVTVPAGASVVLIVVHASAGSATMALFGGSAVPIINGAPPAEFRFNHTLWQSTSASSTIVFTNTDSYFVHWIRAGNV